ncbi:MAG: trehalase [Segetibacter sp.]|nr:trehalase [Segetibacter sp.]
MPFTGTVIFTLKRMKQLLAILLYCLAFSGVPAQTPDVLYGPLFTEVQLKKVFGDNKTFVDALPKEKPSVILQNYLQQKNLQQDSFNVKRFVEQYFILPKEAEVKSVANSLTLVEHLNSLWKVLGRKADVKQAYSSLLPLPNPYIVPGGRFREIYYWDSYFTLLGLSVSNRYNIMESMVSNFAYLINTYGHIPNGNRNYYLSRSQPPYFALMVQLLQETDESKAIYKKYLPAMEKEYTFWMDGKAGIKPGEAHRRVVSMSDSSILNRHFDDKPQPREESYYEDVQTGFDYANTDKLVYTHLRAGAESGWDFSSRWFEDTFHLNTIETANIIPVDLNALMYSYENILAKAYTSIGNKTKASAFTALSEKRKKAIIKYCWNDQLNYFFDYDFTQATTTNKWSLAGVMPLFSEVATKEQSIAVQDHIATKFLKDGGLVTTIYNTGQQWDSPNGWAPLQYIAVKGLLNYNSPNLAKTIAENWMATNERVFKATGKMMEKYNVENKNLKSGGGEYPTQDGFGWTNGVYLKLHSMYRAR